jgi:hypothetical protein
MFGVWCLVFGCSVFGVWCVVLGVERLVFDGWYLVFDVPGLVFGVWCSVFLNWCFGFRDSSQRGSGFTIEGLGVLGSGLWAPGGRFGVWVEW